MPTWYNLMISQQHTSPSSSDPRAINRAKFELELEFVQSLANPFYLHSLAQQNILEQPAFINFLRYLLYFKEKDYARFIQSVYPLFDCSPFLSHVNTAILTRCIISICFSMRNFGLRWKKTSISGSISIKSSLTTGALGKQWGSRFSLYTINGSASGDLTWILLDLL